MDWRKFTILSLLAVVWCTLAGCSQLYNGAFGMADTDGVPPVPGNTVVTAPPETPETPSPFSREAASGGRSAPPEVAQAPDHAALQAMFGPAETPQAPAEPALAGGSAPQPIFIGPKVAPFSRGAQRSASHANPQRAATQHAATLLSLFGQVNGHAPATAGQGHPGSLRQVTFSVEGSDFDPQIDPTGQWLVYASTCHSNDSNIYLKRIDGTAVTQLTNDRSDEAMPTFSPDGKRIAFASNRAGNWDVYIMPATGGQAQQVTASRSQDIHPSFSPDGKQLIYASYGGPSGQWQMVVVDLAHPGAKHYIGTGLFPQWSPADNTIVFQRARQRGSRWFSVWTLRLDDADQASAPTEIAVSANAAVITPTWSKDGKRIVFCTVVRPTADDQSRPRRADVWVVNADGTGRVRLTDGMYANTQPVWSGDGTVYFVSDRTRDGRTNVWSVQAP